MTANKRLWPITLQVLAFLPNKTVVSSGRSNPSRLCLRSIQRFSGAKHLNLKVSNGSNADQVTETDFLLKWELGRGL